ncbi:Ag5r.2 family protein [Megaselia abdita]
MIRVIWLCFILQSIFPLSYSRKVYTDIYNFIKVFDEYVRTGVIPMTTEDVPVLFEEENQLRDRNESYCKGWCRDWISSQRRYKYKTHIACNNNDKFSSKCLYPAMLEMFPDRKDHILSRHNSIRNRAALGTLGEQASQMPALKWDDELARLASLNVKKCEFGVDFCFDKENFEHFGQNIAIYDTSYGPVNYTLLIDEMLRSWQRNEKKFSKMISDEVDRVGCAAIEYQVDLIRHKFHFTCNYNTYAVNPSYPYFKGPAASQCRNGTHHKYRDVS